MLAAKDAGSCEKNLAQRNYNQVVRILPESAAISEYQKLLQSPAKDKLPKPTFLEWLGKQSIKLTNIPDAHQFWIKRQLLLAK